VWLYATVKSSGQQIIQVFMAELTISNASTVSGDNRVRLSVIVIPVEEKSRSDCALEHYAASIRFATWLSTGS